MKRIPLIISGLIFALWTLAHFARLFYSYPVIIGTYEVPMWVSGLGLIVGTFLTFWMFAAACCCRSTCER